MSLVIVYKISQICLLFYLLSVNNVFIIFVLYCLFEIKYYLTPEIACANNVFPHPGGP